jgi:hypothetical protein
VRFEHCYALDQSGAASGAKRECWRDWLHGYTYGQSRDRVEYAAQRFSELSIGDTLPSVDEGKPRPRHAAVAPMPTNAFAPPPNVAERAPASATGAVSAGAASSAAPVLSGAVPAASASAIADLHPPGQDCARDCLERWNTCKEGCKNGPCGVACDRSYRSCVPACFK